jgi:hypothetical protein
MSPTRANGPDTARTLQTCRGLGQAPDRPKALACAGNLGPRLPAWETPSGSLIRARGVQLLGALARERPDSPPLLRV